MHPQRLIGFAKVRNQHDRKCMAKPIIKVREIAVVGVSLRSLSKMASCRLDLQRHELSSRNPVFDQLDVSVDAHVRDELLAKNPFEILNYNSLHGVDVDSLGVRVSVHRFFVAGALRRAGPTAIGPPTAPRL